MKSVKQVIIMLFLFSNCSPEKGKEAAQTPVTKSIEQNSQANSVAESIVCPDSAISYDQYKHYWSEDLQIDENLLTEFKISDDSLSKILIDAIEEQNQLSSFKMYELFLKGIDGEKFLAKQGIAKHISGESPYDLEYYLIHGDTLIGFSDSPTFYYYDQHDSLRVIESYHHDRVEGCSFSKEIKYFKDGKPSLFREFHFYLNCWPSEGDSINGFRRDGNFIETFKFMKQNSQDFYKREFNFFECNGNFIVQKTYATDKEQALDPAENTDLTKYD